MQSSVVFDEKNAVFFRGFRPFSLYFSRVFRIFALDKTRVMRR
jgi:hypothetical protein